MQKKLSFITCIFIFITSFSFAQENQDSRNGKLYFKIGPEYRITPFPAEGAGAAREYQNTNSDLQNSGSAIYYGLDFYVINNLSLGFEHSFRYTLLNYNKQNESGSANTAQIGATNSLFMAYHFNATYYFKVFKNSELFVRVGISLINRNSNFTYKERIFDENGELFVTTFSALSYNMQPKNYAIGYKKNKLEAILGVYATNDAPYFDRSVSYVIPYVKLSYTLGRL